MLRLNSLDSSSVGIGTFGTSDYVWCSSSGIHSFTYHFYGSRYRFTRSTHEGVNHCTDPVVEVVEIHHGTYKTGKTLSNGAVEIDFVSTALFDPLGDFDKVVNKSFAIFMPEVNGFTMSTYQYSEATRPTSLTKYEKAKVYKLLP